MVIYMFFSFTTHYSKLYESHIKHSVTAKKHGASLIKLKRRTKNDRNSGNRLMKFWEMFETSWKFSGTSRARGALSRSRR